jgi:hypothetical protein
MNTEISIKKRWSLNTYILETSPKLIIDELEQFAVQFYLFFKKIPPSEEALSIDLERLNTFVP